MSEEVSGAFVRKDKSAGLRVTGIYKHPVTFLPLLPEDLRNFSRNDRNKIIADCEKQKESLRGGNYPPVYESMLYLLKHGERKE